MSQANKKPSGQASAKLASSMADRAAKTTFSAVESTRSSAENVVRLGNSAMQDFFSSSAGEAQKAQEKAFEISRENAENFAKSADAFTKMLYEMVSVSRGNVETCIECGNMSASFARDAGSEVLESANRTFSNSVELSKEFFACRTINDMFDLQNRLVRQSLDSFFSQSMRLSNMMFEYTTDALEPINERVAKATEQFSKVMAA